MPDFADLMNAMAGVVIAAREWRSAEGTNERPVAGLRLYEALDTLDRLDAERFAERLAHGNTSGAQS